MDKNTMPMSECAVPTQIAHLQKMPTNNTINADEDNSVSQQTISEPCEEFMVDMNSPLAVPEKRCYTVDDIQAILGISRPSVYKLINQKVFHSVMVAGKHRISKKSFDEWLDHN